MFQLWQPSLDEHYLKMDPAEAARQIEDRRARLGDRLVILGHHYQVDDVIRHADLRGDSLKLSQQAADIARDTERSAAAEFVIFCGVHFMAETADMLSPDEISVILPDLSAGCSMADMAQYEDTVEAWEELHEALRADGWTGRIIPITYVNSSAAIKAFVGAHGGACCTSSNADAVFDWAMRGGTEPLADGEDIKILFLPDQHLGRNTAAKAGIDVAQHAVLYDPKRSTKGESLGGIDPSALPDSRVILWAGHCSVHKLFRPEHCDDVRAENERRIAQGEAPTTILVHPECAKEVVDKADLAGSTEYIIQQIRSAEPGSRWAIGTEFHLVNRLANEARERGIDVRILSECQCLCTTMYRIDPPHLLWILDGLCGVRTGKGGADGEPKVRNVVRVHPEVREPALDALERMLKLAAPQPAG
ncbi:MAG: quinolinate synthase NadA [Planctomycetota bacterium]